MATSNGKGQKSYFKVSLVVWNITLLVQWFPNFEMLSENRGSFWEKNREIMEIGDFRHTGEIVDSIRDMETSNCIDFDEKMGMVMHNGNVLFFR